MVMTAVYMPAMEASEFAKWAASALHRAGWNVEMTIQRMGEVSHFEMGKIERYDQAALDEAKRRGAELAAALRVE